MPALLDQYLGRLVLPANADELVVSVMVLAEVRTQPALSLLDLLHEDLLRGVVEMRR